MAAFFSNINAKIKECGTSYFLFIPMAGLIVYTFVFNISMSSPLLLASKAEKAFAVFTLLFLAFAAAAFLTLALSTGLFLKSEAAAKTIKKISLLVFSGLSTLLALAVIENFTYTMFRVGIKNTDGTFAKLGYLALTGALFWFFCKIGEAYRNKIRDSKLPILNAFVGVAGIFALFNLSNNMAAWADDTTLFPQRYNVVIVSSDGIDASRMSLYGYKRKTTPFIDSVADEFLTARNAFPNNGHTTGAITSLLTGMLPTRTKVVFPPDSLSGKNALRSLPRLLRRQGYYANNIAVPHYADASEQNILEAFDKNNNRNMLSSSFPITFNYKATNWFFDRMLSNSIGIVQDVFWLREMPNPFAQVDGAKRGFKYGFNDAKRLKSLLMDIDRAEKPFFINCHLLGTHGPFFDPEIVKFSKDTTNKDAPWVSELYDDAILTFDTYVKRIYLGLKRKGILDKTILVVMSDHGISHDPRKKVPLLIRFPGGKHAGSIDQN
ncbi:MAG: sulfatase-like hydrolase/transferase, partial [Hyphomicrobiaceae bacterium]